jgi:hypothetical protein
VGGPCFIIAAETSARLSRNAGRIQDPNFIYAQLTIGTVLARILAPSRLFAPITATVQSIYEFRKSVSDPGPNVASVFYFYRVLGIGVRFIWEGYYQGHFNAFPEH